MGNSYSVVQQLSREEREEHDYAQLVEAVEAAQLQSGQYRNVQALPGPYIPDAFPQSARLNHFPSLSQGPFPPGYVPQASVHAEPPVNPDIRRDQTLSPDYPPVIPPTPPPAMPQFRIESQAEISSYLGPSHAFDVEDAVNSPSPSESQGASYASEESGEEERPIIIPPPALARPPEFYARPLSITGTTTPGQQSLPQRRPPRPRILVRPRQSASPSTSSMGSESGNAAPLPAVVHVPEPQNHPESPRPSYAPHTDIASPVPQPPIIVQPPGQVIAAQQSIVILPTQSKSQVITVQPPPPPPPQWAEDFEYQRPTEPIIIHAEPSERAPSIQSGRLRRAPSDASDAPIIIQPAIGGQLAVQPAEPIFVPRPPIPQESVSEIVIRFETPPERRRTRGLPGEEYARPRSRSHRVYDREDRRVRRYSRSPSYDNRAQYPGIPEAERIALPETPGLADEVHASPHLSAAYTKLDSSTSDEKREDEHLMPPLIGHPPLAMLDPASAPAAMFGQPSVNLIRAVGLPYHLKSQTQDDWQPPWTVFPLKVFRGPNYKILKIEAQWDDEALLSELRKTYDGLRTVWRKWFSLRSVASMTMVLSDHSIIYPQRIGPAKVSPSKNMRLRWLLHHPSYMRGRHKFMQVLTARTDLGVEFVERWQLSRIAVAIILPVLASVVIGVVYSIAARDPSTAFTIAGYVTSAYSVCLVLVGLLNFAEF